MQFLTTRDGPPASFTTALYDGIAPDGGLYVPETIERWSDGELARLSSRTLTEVGLRPPRGKAFTPVQVRLLYLRAHKLRSFKLPSSRLENPA